MLSAVVAGAQWQPILGIDEAHPAAVGRGGLGAGCLAASDRSRGGFSTDSGGRVGLVFVEGLSLQQGVRQPIELLAVFTQRFDGFDVAVVDDPPDLLIDELLGRWSGCAVPERDAGSVAWCFSGAA
ncbi:MAG TPA: hypothetical protein VE673_02685 [Pseudonocardiaceae bacterium]|nr:hypothetical protein [Pseudonocardiaceae bacterium]